MPPDFHLTGHGFWAEANGRALKTRELRRCCKQSAWYAEFFAFMAASVEAFCCTACLENTQIQCTYGYRRGYWLKTPPCRIARHGCFRGDATIHWQRGYAGRKFRLLFYPLTAYLQ